MPGRFVFQDLVGALGGGPADVATALLVDGLDRLTLSVLVKRVIEGVVGVFVLG